MNWFDPVDNYCERLDPSFWAEPLNALSNASFIAAGLLLLVHWQRLPVRSITALALIINVLVIGIGSFLFHTNANRWSSLADVIPITVFIHFYLLLALRFYLGLNGWIAAAMTLAFFAASPFIGSLLEPMMGSSAMYAPALAAIIGVGFAAHSGQSNIAHGLYLAGAVFAISIGFRAADLRFCEAMPPGTHFVWHLLNGLVLYLLVRLYLRVHEAQSTNPHATNH
jgi:hypothetical protein